MILQLPRWGEERKIKMKFKYPPMHETIRAYHKRLLTTEHCCAFAMEDHAYHLIVEALRTFTDASSERIRGLATTAVSGEVDEAVDVLPANRVERLCTSMGRAYPRKAKAQKLTERPFFCDKCAAKLDALDN